MNGYLIGALILFLTYVLPLVIAAIVAGIVIGRTTASRLLGAGLAGGTAVLGLWVLISALLAMTGNLDVALFPLWNMFLGFLSIPVFVLAAVGAWITHRRACKPPERAGI